MLPITLDVARRRVVLVGRSAGALQRLRRLDEADAGDVVVFADRPDAALSAAAGTRLRLGRPDAAALDGAAVLLVADVAPDEAAPLVALARARRVLVNVEDQPALCDFHMPAIVRRGDLAVAISTGGASPGLARALREWLEALFDADWGMRLQSIAERRHRWRRAGRSAVEVGALTRRLLAARGWLTERPRDAA
jgi:precorrin-2 dehydrogenase/sirohydrochlorin ferrochelatase